MWKSAAFLLASSAVVYNCFRYFAGGVCRCTTRLDGLAVIITGGNSGIGKALAVEVAKRGGEVILACRDPKLGILAQKDIISSTGNNNVHVRSLDLNSIRSIINFSTDIQNEYPEIYALVNNAGVFYYPQELTEDGFDVTLQTNYLGPFILTHHLLKSLKNSEHSRIINVSSEGHRYVTEYDLKAITKNQKETRSHFTAYGVSKLALLLFTKELSKRLLGSNIIVNSANPGNVETPIFRYFPPLSNPILYALQWPIRLVVVKSPRQGAQTILHALLTSHRTTGQYFTDCKVVLPSAIALNDALSKEYYNLTLEILDTKFDTESEC
ncbi:uncharacterized protein CBL_07889 [Carabus blaptoides fortunei]